MKIFKTYKELAEFVGCREYEVEEAEIKYVGRNYFEIDGVEFFKHIKDDKMHYIKINVSDDLDCKEYFMKYEKNEYRWIVYVDDIEKWQECKVLDVSNTRLGINRATVICESGTQLNRVVKFVLDEEDEDFKPDRCIYYMEKE